MASVDASGQPHWKLLVIRDRLGIPGLDTTTQFLIEELAMPTGPTHPRNHLLVRQFFRVSTRRLSVEPSLTSNRRV